MDHNYYRTDKLTTERKHKNQMASLQQMHYKCTQKMM